VVPTYFLAILHLSWHTASTGDSERGNRGDEASKGLTLSKRTQTEEIIKYNNKVTSSVKGNASQGAYEFAFTKNFASQGAERRGEGMLVWRVWKGGCRGGSQKCTLYTRRMLEHVSRLLSRPRKRSRDSVLVDSMPLLSHGDVARGTSSRNKRKQQIFLRVNLDAIDVSTTCRH
jgi:hypothetical protein